MSKRSKKTWDEVSGTRKTNFYQDSSNTRVTRERLLRDLMAASAEKQHALNVSSYSGNLGGSQFGSGYESIVAPTSNPGRPRATFCAYGAKTNTLIIVMRNDGPGGQDIEAWIQYDDVDPQYWEALKMAYSTHTFINTFLAGWTWTKISPGQQPKQREDHFTDGQNE